MSDADRAAVLEDELYDATAEITRLRSVNAALVEALGNVAAACRGSGPWARDHDADTLRTIGKMIEPALTAARTGE